MYKQGHIGLALLAAAPFAILFGLIFGPQWGILTIAFSFITARLPDFDQHTPLLSHRGFSHTIWFACIVSLILAVVVTVILSIGPSNISEDTSFLELVSSNWPTLLLSFLGFMLGFISHLVGDILTEAYTYTVNPFWPISDQPYTLGWTQADSKIWNWGLLLLGIGLAIVALIVITSFNT